MCSAARLLILLSISQFFFFFFFFFCFGSVASRAVQASVPVNGGASAVPSIAGAVCTAGPLPSLLSFEFVWRFSVAAIAALFFFSPIGSDPHSPRRSSAIAEWLQTAWAFPSSGDRRFSRAAEQ